MKQRLNLYINSVLAIRTQPLSGKELAARTENWRYLFDTLGTVLKIEVETQDKCWKCQRVPYDKMECSQQPCGLFRKEEECSDEEKKLTPMLMNPWPERGRQI